MALLLGRRFTSLILFFLEVGRSHCRYFVAAALSTSAFISLPALLAIFAFYVILCMVIRIVIYKIMNRLKLINDEVDSVEFRDSDNKNVVSKINSDETEYFNGFSKELKKKLPRKS